jgi:predicted metal-dependent hydrolase
MDGLAYEIQESARAKRLSVRVHRDGRVVVVRPSRAPRAFGLRGQVTDAQVERFLASKRAWIQTTQEKFSKRAERRKKTEEKLAEKFGWGPAVEMPRLRRGTKAYEAARASARSLVHERLTHYSRLYGLSYGTISIRNQKTRWGSCSPHGNLSFNYRIAFLPAHLADYIVVHELCHTKEHNHSKRFWDLVARTIPEHVTYRKELRTRYVM